MRDSWDQRTSSGGGRFTAPLLNWIGRFGSVTQLIIWVCVVVFVLQLLTEFLGWPVLDHLFALRSSGLRQGLVWQPVTYMFLHDTNFGVIPWHILINLLVLWFIGREVEYFIGPKFFTRLFLLGGLTGAVLWLTVNFHSQAYVVGASAAVLACVIAFATLFPDREITFLLWFIIPVRLKAKYIAIALIALDVLPLLRHTNTGVAHLAHLGGAAFGWVYIKHLGYGQMPQWLAWFRFLGEKFRPRRRPTRPVTTARKPAQSMSADEYMREKVDPILDKIAREGMQSLTKAEREILDSAKDFLRKRQS